MLNTEGIAKKEYLNMCQSKHFEYFRGAWAGLITPSASAAKTESLGDLDPSV